MADTVTSQTISDTSGVKFVAKTYKFIRWNWWNTSKKVDASELTFMTEDGNRKISKIWYSINTNNNKAGVEILWDGATTATALLLSGNGYWDLRTAGNEVANNATTPTGDILLSTKDFVTGDNYTIIVEFR